MPAKDEPPISASRAPRGGLAMMGLILFAMAFLSLYTNYQKRHLQEIETVTISPPAPESAPSLSPSPVAR